MSERYSKFILNSIKEKFGAEKKYEEEEGFPHLNYEVGNTSSLDVAPGVPSAMDERIGSLSQRGGSVMEIIINNPATFQLDKDRMFNVINQLGINISIHSNPDIGYTSAYRGRYDPTHDYFTKYLQEFAIFKKEAEKRAHDEENFGFEIQRINPHISTTPLPALEEDRAQDTGLDPFGYSLTDLIESKMEEKDNEKKNIYRNREFLGRLYRVFFSEEFGDQEQRYYSNFTSFSPQFDKEWRKAQDEIAKTYFNTMTGQNATTLEEKADVISAVANSDPAITREWLELLPDQDFDSVPIPPGLQEQLRRAGMESDSIDNLEDLDGFVRIALGQRYRLSQLARLSNLLYFFENKELNRIRSRELQRDGIEIPIDDFQEDLWEEVESALEEALDVLWTEEAREDDERKISLIPVQAKVGGLTQQLEIPEGKIAEEAYQRNKDTLSNQVEKMFEGKDEMFEHKNDNEILPEEQHMRFLRFVTGSRAFERDMWMESNIMYKIMPAWMATANEEYERHSGWEAPKFLWEILVKQKWEDKEGYNIDLTDPRGDENDEIGYLDLLEESREFQADVAAASAACYVWGHFTQKESPFNVEKEKHFEDIGRKEGKMTWIKWMNEYGIGVNLEAMPGSPQQMYKIWRPKDIVAACRAINITARNDLGEIHEDLDGMPAKFTLDLEHTATFGLDPWKTMDELIEQEKDLAESPIADKYNLKVDADKPLAKVLRMWHLMRAGVESNQGTLHGPWDRGDTQLYTWLYKMVDAGFARNSNETAYIMYEVGGDDRGTVYTARIAMNLIELGVDYEDLDPTKVDPSKKNYGDEKEALMARFFGMDKSTYDREWAKIEEHAFDPLDGLLEAEGFDYTWSGQGAIEEGGNRPQEWMQEEFK